jgi:hypothetical protein
MAANLNTTDITGRDSLIISQALYEYPPAAPLSFHPLPGLPAPMGPVAQKGGARLRPWQAEKKTVAVPTRVRGVSASPWKKSRDPFPPSTPVENPSGLAKSCYTAPRANSSAILI